MTSLMFFFIMTG